MAFCRRKLNLFQALYTYNTPHIRAIEQGVLMSSSHRGITEQELNQTVS